MTDSENVTGGSRSEPERAAALGAYRVTYAWSGLWGRVSQWQRVVYAESAEQAREQALIQIRLDYPNAYVVRCRRLD